LRELFGDVLGGIRDEYEAEDSEPQQMIAPPPPTEAVAPPPSDEDSVEATEFDPKGFVANLFVALGTADSEEALIDVWETWDVERTLVGDDENLQAAFN